MPIDENLRDAVKRGDIDVIRALISAGADVRYVDENGYDALIDGAYNYQRLTEARLIELLSVLIDAGAPLSGKSSYGESALRVLSREARMKGVKFLLDAGADPVLIEFTPLIEAVAFGSIDDLEAVLSTRPNLEERDTWGRTAWLVAVHMGDIPKADLLLRRGADQNACGKLGKPAAFFAVETPDAAILSWLLSIGVDILRKKPSIRPPDVAKRNDGTILDAAVENENLACVDLLISLGVDVNEPTSVATALWHARSGEIAMRLLLAGADQNELTSEARRSILGFPPEADDTLLTAGKAEFLKHHRRRFGSKNADHMNNPFWESMIRSGVNAYSAYVYYDYGVSTTPVRAPIWCAERFGQSLTFLPDGRIVQIAGEHEDHYDPNF